MATLYGQPRQGWVMMLQIPHVPSLPMCCSLIFPLSF